MRSSRLLAAAALVALSAGATVGAPATFASPAPSSSATAAPGTSAPASPSASVPAPTSSATSKPSPHPTATATAEPTAPLPKPSGTCTGNHLLQDIKVTGTGLVGSTLAKGGPAQETSVTFENTGRMDIKEFSTYLFITDIGEEPVTNPVTWGSEAFTVQVKTPGSDWKPVTVEGSRPAVLGILKIAKGEKVTIQVKIAATDKALTALYHGEVTGQSETFDNATTTGGRPGCLSYGASYRGRFTIPGPGTPTTTAANTTPASSGPHLAETGSSSSTLPIAATGAAVLAAGATTLVALRRRKAAASHR
ncbi:LAETG motif-containing sortase-dependent surface protein [Kitasatospora sp. NPDC004240]